MRIDRRHALAAGLETRQQLQLENEHERGHADEDGEPDEYLVRKAIKKPEVGRSQDEGDHTPDQGCDQPGIL